MTTRKVKRPYTKQESPSNLTETGSSETAQEEPMESPTLTLEKRLSEQEATSQKILDALADINKVLAEKGKLPTVKKPEDRVSAMREATKIGVNIERRRNVDLRNPNASDTGFQEGDVIQVSPESLKYDAYKLDTEGEPVKMIYEYQCTACDRVEEYVRGADKKFCPACHNTMKKIATGRYTEGDPAYGVIKNYMYTNRHKQRKYKVWFEKFSESKGSEGLAENEMVLCQR